MQFTYLGRTGLKISRICLGCMSYGDPAWRPWVLDEAASRPFYKRAVEHGINFFDTADMYSLGVSETFTGKLLREYANLEECVVATKVYHPLSSAPNMSGLSRKHIQQGCEASLKRLGVEAIDIYYTHRFDPNVPIDEMCAALDLLVKQGKVRYLGASSTHAWKFAKALTLADRNLWARFVVMQNHYNLVYREEEREMIPLCQAEGVAVVPWSPLARGLLAGKRTSPTDRPTSRAQTDDIADRLYDHPSDWEVAQANQRVAAARGLPPSQTALAWILSKPAVAAPIIGATKLAHLDDAVAALDVQLTPAEIEQLEAPYQPHRVRGFE